METPAEEAKEHSTSFLKKAAKLKGGKGKRKGKGRGKKMSKGAY